MKLRQILNWLGLVVVIAVNAAANVLPLNPKKPNPSKADKSGFRFSCPLGHLWAKVNQRHKPLPRH